MKNTIFTVQYNKHDHGFRVTFCCCGCFGKGTCCSDNEDEDMEKNSVHENVVMSEINDNQYINFHNPDEKPNKDVSFTNKLTKIPANLQG